MAASSSPDITDVSSLYGTTVGFALGTTVTTDLITVTPEDSLTHALDSLGYKDIGHLPVVRKDNRKKIIGIITKGDLIKAYNKKRFIQKKMSWQD